MKNVASKIGAGLLVVLIAFFGLKGCVVTVWTSPTETTTYALHGKDGRFRASTIISKAPGAMVRRAATKR